MSFVITVCNLVQMLYTLASLKMILMFGHCVCDIHKVGKKVSAHIYPAQVSVCGRGSNIKCLWGLSRYIM